MGYVDGSEMGGDIYKVPFTAASVQERLHEGVLREGSGVIKQFGILLLLQPVRNSSSVESRQAWNQ